MSGSDDLLHAILDNPDDDAVRLIYADWLEERGDPRAEFIRVQIEHERLSQAKPAPWWKFWAPYRQMIASGTLRNPPAQHHEKLFRRETELIAAHKESWFPFRHRIGRWECNRGFIDEVWMDAGAFLEIAEVLVNSNPVRHVHLDSVDPVFSQLMQCPRLGRLQTLNLTGIAGRYGRSSDTLTVLEASQVERSLSQLPHLGKIAHVTYAQHHAHVLLEMRFGKLTPRWSERAVDLQT